MGYKAIPPLGIDIFYSPLQLSKPQINTLKITNERIPTSSLQNVAESRKHTRNNRKPQNGYTKSV